MSPRTHRAARYHEGFLSWVSMVSCCIASLLAAVFLSRSESSFRRSVHLLHNRQADQLATAATDLALVQLRAVLARRESTLATRLVQSTSAQEVAGPIPPDRDVPGLTVALEVLRRTILDGREVSVAVEIEITSCEPLVADEEVDKGHDPREKRGVLRITASSQVGNSHRKLTTDRAFKIVNLVPPVTSKFTLFVTKPAANATSADPNDRGAQGYNRFRNRIDGASLPAWNSSLPLIFHHGPADTVSTTAPFDHHRLGWVYLGSENPIVLNLTSGQHEDYGESFHHWSLNDLAAGSTAPQALDYLQDTTSGPVPPFFGTTYQHTSWMTGQTTSIEFSLKKRRMGFYEQDGQSPPGTMDSGLLGIDPITYNVHSSLLHLFGSARQPSPTRVIGNVFAAYPEYSGVVADVDADGLPDATLQMLENGGLVNEGELPARFRLRGSEREEDIYFLEDLKAADGTTASFDSPDDRSYTNPAIFSGSFAYDDHRSRVVVEPYNRSVDLMTAPDSRGSGPQYPGFDPATDYPDLETPRSSHETSLTFPQGGDAPYYQGSLDQLDGAPADLRVAFRFDSLDEFVAWSGQEDTSRDTLELGCNIRIDGESLDLGEIRRIRGGGLIQAPAISLAALERDGDVPVSLMAREKDITCTFQGKVQASLIALEGQLKTGDQHPKIDLTGNLALGQLDPDQIAGGGTVRYDADLDPVRGEGNGYDKGFRVLIADGPDTWGGTREH